MKYMGSKAKVARYIVPIIQKQIERSGYETYLEPFCGGIDRIFLCPNGQERTRLCRM